MLLHQLVKSKRCIHISENMIRVRWQLFHKFLHCY